MVDGSWDRHLRRDSISSQAVHWDKGKHVVFKNDDVTLQLHGSSFNYFCLARFMMLVGKI